MSHSPRRRSLARVGLAACFLLATVGSLVVLDGCGSGHNPSFRTDEPNRPPFIPDGGITLDPPIIGTTYFDPCTQSNQVGFIPAVVITYDIIDLEDVCGEAFHWYSTNNGLTYVPATESPFRPLAAPHPDCATIPDTDDCTPCLPVDPAGASSAGAATDEPDNHVYPTCMSSLGGGGQVNRFYWDIFADGVGFPLTTQVIYCISPTDPFNFITREINLRNQEALENPGGLDSQIDYELFRTQLQQVPTTPGFFCTDSFQVTAPLTRVGITPDDISEIRVGAVPRDFLVPIHITNVNSGGPTCFFVGIAFDHNRMSFQYLQSADYAMGILPTSADLVQGTPLLLTNGGSATLVSPPPATIDGDEDFVVIQVTSPVRLVGGDLFELLFTAFPLPPGQSAAVSLIETIPVGNQNGCFDNPGACLDRADWEIPEVDYLGTTNPDGAADPCDGTDYPFVPEPPVAITFIQNSEPECCIPLITGDDMHADINLAVEYWLVDLENNLIDITPEFSTDGGVTWAPMTEAAADPQSEGIVSLTSGVGGACPAVPGPGDEPCGLTGCPDDFLGAEVHFFVWDIDVDIPAGSGFICDLRVRITPFDGVSAGPGCETQVPYFFDGTELIVRRHDDPTYVVDNLISLDAGGHPVILPQLPDRDDIEVFAISFNGEEIEVTDSTLFTSSDPVVIDVFYDGGADVAAVVNDPTSQAPTAPSPPTALPPCPVRNQIGNQCVLIDLFFDGFLNPPLDNCPVEFFDPVAADLTTQIAACTDLGGPDYEGDRRPHMLVGDVDAGIPGLPSGPPIPGSGGTVDVTFFTDAETSDLGAYSLDLQWDPTVLEFVDIFTSPVVPNLVANTAQVGVTPLALLQWANFTPGMGLTGVVELETVRFTVLCSAGPCSTPFYLTIDQLADLGPVNIGSFVGGAADSATDCSAEFTVP
jgi:hypothetical protein